MTGTESSRSCTALLALLSLLFSPGAAMGQRAGDLTQIHRDKIVRAVRIQGEIKVDGVLDEPEWELAEPAVDFIQQKPILGTPATEPTEVRLLYDDRNLYVGVYCFDSRGRAGITVNDITKDFYTLDSDGFQIVLDTYDDDRNSFLFATNPAAGRFDMQIGADGDAGNTSWDGVWFVETLISDEGWQAEMAIPFKTLRFRQGDSMIWGVNFERRVRSKFEDSHWAPLPPPFRMGRVSLAGTLEGLEQVQQGRNLYIKPYLSTPVTRREGDDVDFQPDAGGDVKIGVSSQLTLDLTVNTDFSQVEADEQQINLTRFNLFFPEKREFFLENAGIFEVGRKITRRPRPLQNHPPDLIPFFSRRIGISEEGELVSILGGARFTGRAGPYTMGFLTMWSDDIDETPTTNFSVVRFRRDVLRKSDVGGLFINKQDTEGRANRTYGVDSNFTFFDHLDITSYFLKTNTPEHREDDHAATFEAAWRDDLFDFKAGHLVVAENFNPEVGFVLRKGIRKTRGDFSLTPRPEKKIPWIREFRPTIAGDYITDMDGNLATRRLEGRFSVTFGDSSFVSVAREARFERLDEPFEFRDDLTIPVGDYNFSEYSLFYQTDPSRMFSGMTTLSTGEFFNGDRDSYGLGIVFRPTFRLAAQVNWTRNDIQLPSGDFDTDLATTKVDYAFSNRMFLNALIQYNSDLREINSNIRFRFVYKPLSDLFVVYNERRSSTGEIIERALIGKLTYMFSF